ncbi:hypothetical protein psyc5s11_49450 [Clostridium gelidum]|uniref:Uncharacterized protein n=1 Tax=Clostridium gelidum TaxID=704125 RepID=A0ABN6J6A7_9CLOT|nr:hypothetical protein [Clostridium gelidum]BCZ48878.1 hypothetical protein psyc5s11_49450 [Clostridium gelidum]
MKRKLDRTDLLFYIIYFSLACLYILLDIKILNVPKSIDGLIILTFSICAYIYRSIRRKSLC